MLLVQLFIIQNQTLFNLRITIFRGKGNFCEKKINLLLLIGWYDLLLVKSIHVIFSFISMHAHMIHAYISHTMLIYIGDNYYMYI